jgi:hypothetical protein
MYALGVGIAGGMVMRQNRPEATLGTRDSAKP